MKVCLSKLKYSTEASGVNPGTANPASGGRQNGSKTGGSFCKIDSSTSRNVFSVSEVYSFVIFSLTF